MIASRSLSSEPAAAGLTMTTQQIADLIRRHHWADLAAMNADPRTVAPLKLADLEAYLMANNLLVGLRALAGDATSDASLRDGVANTLAMLDSARLENIHTEQLQYAIPVARLMGALQRLNSVEAGKGLTHAQADAIYALGGGKLVPAAITQQQWDDTTALNALEDAKTAEIQWWQDYYNGKLAVISSAASTADFPARPAS